MFVSRTRNSGTPCRSLLFGSRQKTSSATISTIPEHILGLQPSLESGPKALARNFYIDAAEEGECPFLCTPSPKPADIHRLADTPIVDNRLSESVNCGSL